MTARRARVTDAILQSGVDALLAHLDAPREVAERAVADVFAVMVREKRRESPERRAWHSIKQRCYNPRVSQFKWYGGRGIKVCAAWRQSFATFLVDVGARPSPKHSRDRINNNGDYEPGNVRWATHREQMHNTRRRVVSDAEAIKMAADPRPSHLVAKDFGVSGSSVRRARQKMREQRLYR